MRVHSAKNTIYYFWITNFLLKTKFHILTNFKALILNILFNGSFSLINSADSTNNTWLSI